MTSTPAAPRRRAVTTLWKIVPPPSQRLALLATAASLTLPPEASPAGLETHN